MKAVHEPSGVGVSPARTLSAMLVPAGVSAVQEAPSHFTDWPASKTLEVKLHDGSRLYLKKVSEDYNPTDKHAALRLLQETDKRGEFATGILYVAPGKQDLVDLLNIVDEPLATLPLDRVRPPRKALDEFMEAHR